MRVKLIFNPISGSNSESPIQLMDVITEIQAWNMVPEIYLIESHTDMDKVVRDALADGIQMMVVCGGDGTVSSVARAVIGTKATLGIIPTGTQNNVAFSLGIPTDIPAAIAILRNGKRLRIDIGICTQGSKSTPFIEVCSVGLFSTLFSSADDIQHGNLSRVGTFLSTFASTPPSDIILTLEDEQEIRKVGHLVLISNMPFIVRHYQVGGTDALVDGFLDVLFFSDLSKMDLIGYMIKGPGTDKNEDPRIQHFRVRRMRIETTPAMPVMVDGITLENGALQIEVKPHALAVMVGSIAPGGVLESGEIIGK